MLSLEDDVLRLRLHGSCDGCPASASNVLELAIKQEFEIAPDLLGIEVEGLVDAPRTFSGLALPLVSDGNGSSSPPVPRDDAADLRVRRATRRRGRR